MNLQSIISISLVLFSVIDIVGSLPVIVDMKKKGYKIESLKASLVALLIMTLFLYLGQELLGLFGIDVESFAVAGAIIIFIIGLEMILEVKIFRETPEAMTGTIVPIAFPLVAGAGTMTTIISLRAKYEAIDIQIAILLNIIFVYLILRSSNWISRKLGPGGTNVFRKVFGIILLSIAIKLFKENFKLPISASAPIN